MTLDADARKRLEELADAYDSGVVYIRTTRFSDYAKAIRALLSELDRLQGTLRAYRVENEEAEQILGKALGYPWFKDDQTNFPGATEADGVCIGEHVLVTIADEAAKKLDRLQGGEGWVLVPREPTEAMIAACLSAVAEWRKTLTADEAILRRSEPTVQGRVFLASATPEEKAAIRWAAMLASRPDEPK